MRRWMLAVSLVACLGGCCHGPTRDQATIDRLRKEEQARLARLPDDQRPFDARWGEVQVAAREQGGVTETSLVMRDPKLRIFRRAARPGPRQVPDVQSKLRSLIPVNVNEASVFDGQVDVVLMDQPHKPELWLHDVQASIENIGTRKALQEHEPVLVTAVGHVQRTGTMRAFITFDPWGSGLDFAGRVEILGLKSEELYGFIQPKTGLRAPRGTIDVYIAFVSQNGHLTGGVKPVVHDLKVRPAGGSCLKSDLANLAIHIFGKGKRERIATVVPIQGDLTGPNVEIWPTIVGLIYNAFIQGIASGFGGLPPQLAGEPKGKTEQTLRVIVGGDQPSAKPADDKGGGK